MKLLSNYPSYKKDKMFSQINRRLNDSWQTIMEIISIQVEDNFLNEVLSNLRVLQFDAKNVN